MERISWWARVLSVEVIGHMGSEQACKKHLEWVFRQLVSGWVAPILRHSRLSIVPDRAKATF